MHLYIFHYHLLPGGVTDVIIRMVEALKLQPGPVDAITIVSGSAENLEAVAQRVSPDREAAPRPAVAVDERSSGTPGVSFEVMPEIGYISRSRIAGAAPNSAGPDAGDRGSSAGLASTPSADPVEERAAPPSGPIGQVSDEEVRAGADEIAPRTERLLRDRCMTPDAVWWVHNHHLGKNPTFTRALARIAAEGIQPIVYQIHDFPECGRYANLHLLHAAGIEELYPQPARTRYVAINTRDAALLAEAGIAEPAYLPNPVPPAARNAAREPRSNRAVRERLAAAFGTRFPAFDPARPLLLYPVRTIRRKNVLEAALLGRLLPSRPSLIVTLPGVSAAERSYSSLVERAFNDGLAIGLWGIGNALEEAGLTFGELNAAADAFISTSVQEGFGFQFIAPLVERAPLVARQLPVFADVAPLYEGTPAAVYDAVSLPWSSPLLSDPRALLRFRYEERLQRLTHRLPAAILDRLNEDLDALFARPTVDFSFLPPDAQYAQLRAVATDAGFRAEVENLNAELIASADRALGSSMPERGAAVEERFGYRRFATRVAEILSSLDRPGHPVKAGATERVLLERFAKLDYQRLLYE